MNFHNVRSIDVERNLEKGWTTIKITRRENISVDWEDEMQIASEFGIDKWDMPTIRRRLNAKGTVTDEITFFHEKDQDIGITVETIDR